MNERISDKIKEIETYLEQLEEIKPNDLEEYIRDFKTKAACERYVERLIEAVVDLAFLVIKEKELPSPEGDLETFDILLKKKIIPSRLARRLQDAKRMRNILAYEYGKVDDKLVFDSIKEELENDIREFIKAIERVL